MIDVTFQPMNTKELWQWIHYSYGEELGVTSSDEDYIPPPCIEELQEQLSKESLPEEEVRDYLSVSLFFYWC